MTLRMNFRLGIRLRCGIGMVGSYGCPLRSLRQEPTFSSSGLGPPSVGGAKLQTQPSDRPPDFCRRRHPLETRRTFILSEGAVNSAVRAIVCGRDSFLEVRRCGLDAFPFRGSLSAYAPSSRSLQKQAAGCRILPLPALSGALAEPASHSSGHCACNGREGGLSAEG